ncbi:MAG TPA: hypothetical protein VM097_07115 [Mycobacteriales bacterium]|nr:hypothetical protein [Mycobacteriales bacterium]
MLAHRTLVLALVTSLALPALGAAAAPKKPKLICNMVLDDKGDPYVLRQQPDAKQADDALDLVSADIASNATTMTMVIRLAKLAVPPATSPVGGTYQVTFTLSGNDETLYYALVSTDPSGAPFSEFGTRDALPAVTSVATVLGTPTAVVDLAKSQVRASWPLSLFGSGVTLKKGVTKVFPVEVTAGRGTHGRGVFADDATGSKGYPLGAPSCVTVGK